MLAVSFLSLGLHFKPGGGFRIDVWPGMVVAITIPLVLSITFVVMFYWGVGLHKISLGALTGNLTNGPVIVNGNDPRVRTTTQDLVDASLTVNFNLPSGADAYVRVFGRNLANNKTTTHAFTVAGLWSFATAREPRT